MNFHRLIINNLGSIIHAEVPLTNEGLIFIKGVNHDSSVCGSNGSGKSLLIVDSLFWVLFGKTPRGLSGSEVVHRGSQEGCSASLEFFDGQSYWSVTRYQDHPEHKNNLYLHRYEEPSWIDESTTDKRVTQRKLEGLIRLPMEVIQTAIVLGQNSITFAKSTDAGKKQVLETVLDFDQLNSASAKAKAKCGTLRTEMHTKEGSYSTMEKNLAFLSERLSTLTADFKKWEEEQILIRQKREQEYATVKVALSRFEEQFKSLQEKQKIVETSEQEARLAYWKFDAEKQELETNIHSLELQLAGSESPEKRKAQLLHRFKELNQQYQKHHSSFEELVQEHKATIADYDQRISELQQKVTSLCPTCNQPLPEQKQYELQQQREAEAKKIQDQQAAYNGKFEAKRAKLTEELHIMYHELTAVETEVALLEATGFQSHPLETEIIQKRKVLDQKILERDQCQVKLNDLSSEKNELTNKKQDLDIRFNSLTKTKEGLEEKLREKPSNPHQGSLEVTNQDITSTKEKMSTTKSEIEKLRHQISLYDFWVSGFGKKGIQSYMLDSVIPFLNERVAEYASIMWNGETLIEFRTQRTLKSEELREDFHIAIDNCHGAQTYSGCSEGERERIDICIALALQDLITSRLGTDFNLCILDEVCRFTDDRGAECYFRLLQKLAERRSSVLVITHNPTLGTLASNTWIVEKSNGVTSLSL